MIHSFLTFRLAIFHRLSTAGNLGGWIHAIDENDEAGYEEFELGEHKFELHAVKQKFRKEIQSNFNRLPAEMLAVDSP